MKKKMKKKQKKERSDGVSLDFPSTLGHVFLY